MPAFLKLFEVIGYPVSVRRAFPRPIADNFLHHRFAQEVISNHGFEIETVDVKNLSMLTFTQNRRDSKHKPPGFKRCASDTQKAERIGLIIMVGTLTESHHGYFVSALYQLSRHSRHIGCGSADIRGKDAGDHEYVHRLEG